MLQPNSAALALSWGSVGGMPNIVLPGDRVLRRPHPEWFYNQLRWRWLLDSWEGGEAYRMATYGVDVQGLPIRNLIRHKREYPSPNDESYSPQAGRPAGTDPAAQATDDDYEMRRARQPVPMLVAEVVETYLGAIYEQEVKREGPPELERWWKDVDGRGTSIAEWVADTYAPMLLVLGNLDVLVDRPALPAGAEVRTRRDEMDLGLDTVVISHYLPENVVWWELDRRGRYAEALVREVQDDLSVRWRYWTDREWRLYDAEGRYIEHDAHGMGLVPITRTFDRRRPRSKHVGLPRLEAIAECQRELYNRQSELILSDTLQAFPLLQGPDDYVKPDGTIPVGPSWLLPKKSHAAGSTVTYEGFEYIDPPKGGAESIRQNCYDIREAVDRLAKLTKPAGTAGTNANTVAQSGVSKELDDKDGTRLLGKLCKVLARNEEIIGRLALRVLTGKDPDPQAVKVTYPSRFSLASVGEIADMLGKVQLLASSAGQLPKTEGTMLKAIVREGLKGTPEEQFSEMDAEIDALVKSNPREQEQETAHERQLELAQAQPEGVDEPVQSGE